MTKKTLCKKKEGVTKVLKVIMHKIITLCFHPDPILLQHLILTK